MPGPLLDRKIKSRINWIQKYDMEENKNYLLNEKKEISYCFHIRIPSSFGILFLLLIQLPPVKYILYEIL